jgi:hypothetical protein
MIEFNSLVNLVSQQTGFKKELVEEALRHKYNWIRETLISTEYPAILDTGLGSFILSESRLKRFTEKYPEDLEHKRLYEKIYNHNQSRKKQ